MPSCSEVTCSISADKMNVQQLSSITANIGNVTAGSYALTNYQEDQNGNPTQGAKMDDEGQALKVAPGNLRIGAYTFDARFKMITGQVISGTGSSVTWMHGITGTNYAVVCSPTAYTGAAAINAFMIKQVVKSSGSCQILTMAAPGAGCSVTWDFCAFQL